MSQLRVDPVQCEALFASELQESDVVTPEAATAAISHALEQLGPVGCACRMAQEFGDHPEAAHDRMVWAHELVTDLTTAA